tara:strand:- start:299 stop:490 length:192 start_codon:yes stop_codon:yes gene_type:complete
MIYPPVNSLNMKLRPQHLTQPPIFENGDYEHPWYAYLNKPNPPTKEAIEKAKFKDKTYQWKGK